MLDYDEFKRELCEEIEKEQLSKNEMRNRFHKEEMKDLNFKIESSQVRIGILDFLSSHLLVLRENWETLDEGTRITMKKLVDRVQDGIEIDLYGIMKGESSIEDLELITDNNEPENESH